MYSKTFTNISVSDTRLPKQLLKGLLKQLLKRLPSSISKELILCVATVSFK